MQHNNVGLPPKENYMHLCGQCRNLDIILLGRQFIARVDHKPLIDMLKNKMTPLMEGWMDTILQFDFTTIYLPGEENELADALSRAHDVDS